jgi:DNA-binding transcriptional ArsR family regulator
LRLLSRLCDEGPSSITRLAGGFRITRQAVTKHLRVMQKSGLVHSRRSGRERVWQLDPHRLDDVRRHLEFISRQWDDALNRLRSFVED